MIICDFCRAEMRLPKSVFFPLAAAGTLVDGPLKTLHSKDCCELCRDVLLNLFLASAKDFAADQVIVRARK